VKAAPSLSVGAAEGPAGASTMHAMVAAAGESTSHTEAGYTLAPTAPVEHPRLNTVVWPEISGVEHPWGGWLTALKHALPFLCEFLAYETEHKMLDVAERATMPQIQLKARSIIELRPRERTLIPT
jgi:hypothetical protein